jgi:predicted NACHT family NTPase
MTRNVLAQIPSMVAFIRSSGNLPKKGDAMPDWPTAASFLIFVKALDWTKIISAAVPLILGIALAWWKGGFRFVFRKIQRLRAERKYKSELKRTISSLAVIGRREGFDLAKVYVEIDIAKSNLMNKSDNEMVWTPKTFVLVGGPGAGKSTYVKKLLLDQLATKQSLPFFLRLREYSGEKIEDLLAAKLDILGIVHSLEFLRSQLRASGCLCVLDGLDEVRPAHQHAAHEAINSFHKSYFLERGQGRLIVTCRKEAYRSIPLELPEVWEVVPLKDNQIKEFARTWPLGFPNGKSAEGEPVPEI